MPGGIRGHPWGSGSLVAASWAGAMLGGGSGCQERLDRLLWALTLGCARRCSRGGGMRTPSQGQQVSSFPSRLGNSNRLSLEGGGVGVSGGVAFQAGDPVSRVSLLSLWLVVMIQGRITILINHTMHLSRLNRLHHIRHAWASSAIPFAAMGVSRLQLHARPRPFLFDPSIKVGYLLAQSRKRLLAFILLLMGIKHP